MTHKKRQSNSTSNVNLSTSRGTSDNDKLAAVKCKELLLGKTLHENHRYKAVKRAWRQTNYITV